jgi:cobalt-precorrin-5B (C1)-methyltransferase
MNVRLSGNVATATVKKDAGDDPDVTDKALIITSVELVRMNRKRLGISIRGGAGVGVVTKPGLKVGPGRPAINPVPLKMIRRAVIEAARETGIACRADIACRASITPSVIVTVSVPKGEELALKTMNARLGIVGGISILGTTGIVEPMSLSAYRHSIACALSVALAAGSTEVVLSTGRSTEKVMETQRGLRAKTKLKPEAFILTGDHMGFALKEAAGMKGFKRVVVAGQFGKFSKLAAAHFETHCADSSIDLGFIASLCTRAGVKPAVVKKVRFANTARHAFFILKDEGLVKIFKEVSKRVRVNSGKLIGGAFKVRSVLVGYDNEIV